MLSQCLETKKAAGRAATAATTTRQSESYTPPRGASSETHRTAWLDRAAAVLTALVVNLQEATHLSPAERETGWVIFEELLGRYVVAKHQRAA